MGEVEHGLDPEERLDLLEQRLARLERRLGLAPLPAPASGASGAAAAGAPPKTRSFAIEEFLGRHGLALAGGGAVLLGLGFFVVLAASRGWIDESVRVLLAAGGSAVLLALGAWLHQRRGRTQAALAMVGTGIAGLFLSTFAATTLYALLAPIAGLAAAGAIGLLALLVAVRLDSAVAAGVGILGALLSPALVDAPASGLVIAFLAAALAAGTIVLVWRDWDWLGLLAFAAVTPQLAYWALSSPPPAPRLPVLALFGALHLAAAVGYGLRARSAPLRLPSILLVAANAACTAAFGAITLDGRDPGVWVAAVACAHGLVGVLALAGKGAGRRIALTLLGAGLTLGNIAFGMLADGVVLPIGWAASAAVLMLLGGRGSTAVPAARAARVQLGLAGLHVLVTEAPVESLIDGAADLRTAALALAAIAVGAAICRFWAITAVALLYLASVAAVTLIPGQPGQLALSALWAACGLLSLWFGLRRDLEVPRRGGLGLLLLALGKAVLYDLSELDTGYRAASFVALGLLLIGGALAYQRLRPTDGGS